MNRSRSTSRHPIRIVAMALMVILGLGCAACAKKQESEKPPAEPIIQTGQVASAEGIPIYYTLQGAGSPALVFVHGWSTDGSYWSEQLDNFARSYQVVAVDLAGHGQSGLGRERWTMAAFGADVNAVVDKLGLQQVILIGHSMGGLVCVEAARLMPGKVIGIIGVDTLQDMGRAMTPDEVDAFVAPLRENFVAATQGFVRELFPEGADSHLIQRIADDMSSAPPEVGLGAIQEVLSHDLTPALKEIAVPVHCINADYWPTNVEGNRRLNPGFQVTTMSGVGHFLYLEKPEEFNRLLATAIKGFTAEARGAARQP